MKNGFKSLCFFKCNLYRYTVEASKDVSAAAAAEDADAAANDAAGGNPAEELGGPVHFETLFC